MSKVTKELIHPRSIVVVGASNDISKPGGKILMNLLDGNFKGELYASNPKEDEVQGVKSYRILDDLPQVDMAILAVAAKHCLGVVDFLSHQRGTKAFIIISAGFSEENEEGSILEKQIVKILDETGSCLIGPNCIGVINTSYSGCFTWPIPKLDPNGADFISGSGATAVYVMELAIPQGLTFNSVYSVGNSAQIGIEDMLEYLDDNFDPYTSSRVKLLYLEAVNKPQKLLKHASSLIRKGCRIAAIKAGSSEAGSRAASSHTGALANSDTAVDALLRKAGIVRCHSREELAVLGALFMHKELKGPNMAIITHAGGPAVMLTDILSDGGLKVPAITGPKAEELLTYLHPGSSVANPIDILATGKEEQLSACMEFADEHFDEIDGMVVIFGSPGLFSVNPIYDLLDKKMKTSKKPVYPILPSIINAKEEIDRFLSKGRINFPDEVAFGRALVQAYHTPEPASEEELPEINRMKIREIVEGATDGYLGPESVQGLLDAAGIPTAKEIVESKEEALLTAVADIGFPMVMKVVGPVHKSDVGGVVLNVQSAEQAKIEFSRLMNIQDATAVLLQQMLSGQELFIGAKEEGDFGHLLMCGLGGIFIEVLKDVQAGLAPLSLKEVESMLSRLKGKKLLEGTRGQAGINIDSFIDCVRRVSALVSVAPEIAEMDLNPLLGTPEKVIAVDARIRIKSV
ncbi:MAG: acetate--CoA ligase family protein [Bacteroidota bacterium]|nr:acetate--CoA ligase family protein [Bacteroidota bacterium]